MVKVISGLKNADLEQAQEESAGQHRVSSLLGWSTRAMGSGFLVRSRCLCPLGGRDGFACGEPLHRWGQRLIHLAGGRACRSYG